MKFHGQRQPHRDEIVQRVRRYKRTAFIKQVASLGGNVVGMNTSALMKSWLYPWNLVDMADISICRGCEDRPLAPSDDDIREISAMMHYCDKSTSLAIKENVNAAIAALCYQQFSLEVNTALADGMRLIALFDHLDEAENQVLCTENEVVQLFGSSIRDYFAGIVLLDAVFSGSKGIVGNSFFTPGTGIMDAITALVDEDVILGLVARLSTDINSYKKEAALVEPVKRPTIDGARYIPLYSTPIIKIDESLVAPVSGLISKTLSPNSVLYRGVDIWGQDYINDIGRLFEIYVGKQLNEAIGGTVFSKVNYLVGKTNAESIDWFLETNSFLYLIEVKASIVPLSVRSGAEDYFTRLKDVIGKAAKQIDRTASLVSEGEESFAHLPEKELRGIVITLDEFFFSSNPINEHEPILPEESGVPKVVIPIGELELIVAYSQTKNIEEIFEVYFDRNESNETPRDQFKNINIMNNPMLEKCSEDFQKRMDTLHELQNSFS